MRSGIALRELRLTGPGMPDAAVTFEDGLNVISGPSDTGKSFILECIDFALGAGTAPEAIPESQGYSEVSLTLEAHSDAVQRTIKRALSGGSLRLVTPGEPPRSLKAKHRDGDRGTVSGYLLDLSGLAGNKVRTNARGNVRGLSFRDIAHLTLIDEDAVTTKQSPIYGRIPANRTVEAQIFRLLVTGEDDSSVANDGDSRVARALRSGQRGLLERLLQEIKDERSSSDQENFEDLEAAETRLDELERAAETAARTLEEHREAVATLEAARLPVWRGLRGTESRIQFLQELRSRFDLLAQQYASDLRRLDATAEAAERLEQLAEERCPVCGALAEHHDRQHADGQPTPEEVVAASRAEAGKIRILMQDLDATIGSTVSDIAELSDRRAQQAAELDSVETEINAELRPQLSEAVRRYRDAEEELRRYSHSLQLAKRERKLRDLHQEVSKIVPQPTSKDTFAGVTSAQAEPFSQTVESLLRSWRFPDLGRVTFSDKRQDVVISGQNRSSRGQGVRALTHAAFTLAVLRVCLDEKRPNPGFVVIDSPLMVYEEPDPDEEGFPNDVKAEFYRSLAREFRNAQVVILENEQPPTDIEGRAALIHFTKRQYGRYGFFPTGSKE